MKIILLVIAFSLPLVSQATSEPGNCISVFDGQRGRHIIVRPVKAVPIKNQSHFTMSGSQSVSDKSKCIVTALDMPPRSQHIISPTNQFHVERLHRRRVNGWLFRSGTDFFTIFFMNPQNKRQYGLRCADTDELTRSFRFYEKLSSGELRPAKICSRQQDKAVRKQIQSASIRRARVGRGNLMFRSNQ